MKQIKILLASIFALALAACSNADTAEETTLMSETTSNAVTSEEASAETDEITTSAEPETEAKTESETETETETTSETLPTAVTEVDGNGIMTLQASENTKYYECRFTNENVVTDPEKFGDKALLENAIKLLEESDICSAVRGEMDIEAEELGYTQNGEYNFECKFKYAVTSDFNGDGQQESAFLFTFEHNCSEAFFTRGGMTSCLVFANGNGNITISDEEFSSSSELTELKYNGFSHLVVNGGHNNMSSKSCIYSVGGSGLKLEFSDGKIHDYDTCIVDNIMLKMTIPQYPNWLVCWNDDIKAYVAVDAVYLGKEESDKILPLLPVDNEFGSDAAISVIGGRYYTVCYHSDGDEPTYYNEYTDSTMRNLPYFSITYTFDGDEYTRLADNNGSSIQIGVRPDIDLAYLEGFDFNSAENNIIPIE